MTPKEVLAEIKDAKPKRSKYGVLLNRPKVDGIRFASQAEENRYHELKALEKAGAICALRTQPRYALEVRGVLICTYVADFVYFEEVAGGVAVVEDVKGVLTDVYKLKKKLMKAIYGIEIRETGLRPKLPKTRKKK